MMVDMSHEAIAAKVIELLEDVSNGRGELNVDNAIAMLVGKVVALEMLVTVAHDRINKLQETVRQTGNE